MPKELMDFSLARHYAIQGKSVARSGWNGKGMFVYIERGVFNPRTQKVDTTDEGLFIYGVPVELFEQDESVLLTRMPQFVMRAANGELVPGWLASQTDMLAHDWVVL